MRSVICYALLLGAVSLTGCSFESRASVEGRVTYAGKPLDVATITFLPTSEEGIKCGGIIENSQYKIESKFGPKPGPHRVEIRWAKPTGKKSRNEFGEEIENRKEGLPEKYHVGSSLKADIKLGKNIVDFQLEE